MAFTAWTLLRIVSLTGVACAFSYYLLAMFSAWRFFGRRDGPPAPAAPPPVSLLKPVRGLDRDSYENFASFCRQIYPAYEILFAVADHDDPAIPTIERIICQFPAVPIRLLIGCAPLGSNSKVNKLCRLAREARHDLLVVSDSDIRVPPGYLLDVVAPFQDPRVGIVTSLYVGLSDGRLGSELEAIWMSSDFAAGVLAARLLEGITFALGATMALRRQQLAEVGGFEALVDYCADDYELGERITAAGYRAELLPRPVLSECVGATFGRFCRHQIRWMVTMRHSRPLGYLGLVFAQGLPWALAAAALAPSARVAGACLAAYLVLRVAMSSVVGIWGMRDGRLRGRLWLLPLRDALWFALWIVGLFRNRVVWRGRRFILRNRRMVPITSPAGRV